MKETGKRDCTVESGSARNSGGSCCGGGSGIHLGVVVVLLLAGFAIMGYAGIFDTLLKKSPAESAKAAGVVETADAVKIPLKSLDSGKALFLSLESEGRQMYYFALKSRDGAYRAALDACDVCFRRKRGYRQEGDLMVCNNCGQTFPSNRIGEIKGGCNPHPLSAGTEDGHLVIRKTDITQRADYFARKRS
ncbi:MAG: hypothetical protein OHK0028_10340 [Deltaproteobacteria bacterium]